MKWHQNFLVTFYFPDWYKNELIAPYYRQSWAKSVSGRYRYCQMISVWSIAETPIRPISQYRQYIRPIYQFISVSSFADTSITPKSQYRRYIRPILSVDIGMNYRQYLDNVNIAISAIYQTDNISWYRYELSPIPR